MRYHFYDDEQDVNLPSHKEVCPRCGGDGTQDVWEGGMTGDEMAEQGPEFFEDYMNGVYSKRCEECNGRNVVDVVDRDKMTPELRDRYDQQEREKYELEAMEAAERRFGC